MIDPSTGEAPSAPLTLPELRAMLAQATDEHRWFEADARVERALAEQRAIDSGPAYAALKNEPERARFLAIVISRDDDYAEALKHERKSLAECESIRADIEGMEDERRERQAAQRDRELDLRAAELEHERASLALQARLFEHHVSGCEWAQIEVRR